MDHVIWPNPKTYFLNVVFYNTYLTSMLAAAIVPERLIKIVITKSDIL